MHFLGYYMSAFRACCALKFLHTLQIDQALLAHTGTGRGSPKILIVKKLKFGLKFSVLGSITSGLLRVSSRNFFQSTCREAGVINWVEFLEGSPQKIQEGQKIVQNFSRFLTTFDFDREYPRKSERICISKIRKVVYQLPTLPRWVKKVGVLWSINEKVIEP